MTGHLELAGIAERQGSPRPGPREIQQHKLSVIGQMASSIAHELSNPLTTILASAQSILALKPKNATATSLEQALSTEAWEDLELILSEARRAGEILSGLLTFARQDTPERRPTAVMEILRHTKALSRHHLEASNVTLQLDVKTVDAHDPCCAWVVGDANQLQQVLLNLIINARQAIAEAKSSGKISIVARRDSDDAVVITVEDDGPGVPPNLRRIIFQPFYTTKSPGQGTGLGLSVSAGIIRAQGGDIWVEDGTDGGARFIIRLPALSKNEPKGAADLPTLRKGTKQADPGGGHDGLSVLLVDDDPAVRRSVSRVLRHSGYHVEAVSTGDAAIAMLRARRFDAIVSDLRMPGLSGEQFFHLVKCEFPSMARRIVFSTGDTVRQEARDFLELSGCPALYKPYELSQLTKLVEAVCRTAKRNETSRQSSAVRGSRRGRMA